MISLKNYVWMASFSAALTATLSHADTPTLTTEDVKIILAQGAKAALGSNPKSVIAVTDREGFVLGVYGVTTPADKLNGGITEVNAIAKAGTAGYLSSNTDAFTSRTAGYIIQQHFPPGVMNTATGPLVGVGLSSLPFSDVNHFRPADPKHWAEGISGVTMSGNPGGVPLYKGGVLVGGVGVDNHSGVIALTYESSTDVNEYIAVVAQAGYNPPDNIVATKVLINGFRLPYTSVASGAFGLAKLEPDRFSASFHVFPSPGQPFNAIGYHKNYVTPSPFPDVPGEVRNQIIDSPLLATSKVKGQLRLSKEEVAGILHDAAARAMTTRGAIRNPIGPAQVFVVVVDYYNPADPAGVVVPNSKSDPAGQLSGPPTRVPVVLGSFRTPDATVFSYDVAAQKARTALFYSNDTMAMSSRTVGFLAQTTYPPGIDGTAAGPYYFFQESVSHLLLPPMVKMKDELIPLALPLPLKTYDPPAAPPPDPIIVNAFLPNGITIFPGGFPLYRNGILIGAIGVSGDGVDQDDMISASGTSNFLAPDNIRADTFTYRGARLPYAKFPRDSNL